VISNGSTKGTVTVIPAVMVDDTSKSSSKEKKKVKSAENNRNEVVLNVQKPIILKSPKSRKSDQEKISVPKRKQSAMENFQVDSIKKRNSSGFIGKSIMEDSLKVPHEAEPSTRSGRQVKKPSEWWKS
jgi:hypothetical protein